MSSITSQADTSASPWLTDGQQSIWRDWIFVTGRLDSTLARQMQTDSSISISDYAVLVYLSEHPHGRERIVALAEALQWDRSRASHQISRMIKRGLVRRELCSNDKRGAFVAIEDLGMKTIQDAAPRHAEAVREHFFDPLDSHDAEDLARILAKLSTQFKE